MKNNQTDLKPRQKHSSHISSVFVRAILVSACLAILVTAVQLIVQSMSHSVEAASSQKGLISRDELGGSLMMVQFLAKQSARPYLVATRLFGSMNSL